MKSDKATIQQRVEEVLTIRLQGAEFLDIRQYASEKKWGVGDRQLWRYIRESDELLARALEKNREKVLNRIIAQRRALYARCMAVSDYSNARLLLRDEEALFERLWFGEEIEQRVRTLEEQVAAGSKKR